MLEKNAGQSDDLEPVNSPIPLNDQGYGEIEIEAGLDIYRAYRIASMIAVTEDIPIQFKFNGTIHRVSQGEARNKWTQRGVVDEIYSSRRSIEAAVTRLQGALSFHEKEIENLKKLGEILYGDEFAERTKDL